MPQLIHLRRQEKTFVPNGTARLAHLMITPELFGFARYVEPVRAPRL